MRKRRVERPTNPQTNQRRFSNDTTEPGAPAASGTTPPANGGNQPPAGQNGGGAPQPLEAGDIVPNVRAALRRADRRGPGDEHVFWTAYQVLDNLAPRILARLILERGAFGGKGAGVTRAASEVVKDALEILRKRHEVEVRYLDTRAMKFDFKNYPGIIPSQPTSGVYRLKLAQPST